MGNVGSNGGGHLMDLAGTYDAKPDKVCPPPIFHLTGKYLCTLCSTKRGGLTAAAMTQAS